MPGKQLRPGDAVELAVTGLDDLGAGVAWLASAELRVHVPGTLPGERVTARLAHLSVHAGDGGREAWADLLAVVAPSPDRRAAPCTAYGACGGCALMGLSYPAQLAHKRQRLAAQFVRYPDLAAVAIDACVPSPATLGYRNQAKYVYGRAGELDRPVLGAFAPHSHRVVDLAGCRVVEPVLEEVRHALLDILVAREVEPFDERRRTSALRYVVMRANQAGQVLVTLVVARPDWNDAAPVAETLAATCTAVAGVVLNENPTAGNRILGESERPLWGRSALEDTVGDVRVRLASRSFFQANRQVAARIYRDIVGGVPAPVARAVDVYAGAGPIALSLAPAAEEVVAIEENQAATATAATFIAELGGSAARVRLVTADAGAALASIGAADLVVVDPPRKGCDAAVLAALARLRPGRLYYLSCDPVTLARDLVVLVASGARVTRVAPYDMMPHTPHVETLARVELS